MQNLSSKFRQVKEDMAKTRQFREMDTRVQINPVKENRAKGRRIQATDSLVLTNLPRYQITGSVRNSRAKAHRLQILINHPPGLTTSQARNSKAKAQRFQSTDNHVLNSLLPRQIIDNAPSRTNQALDYITGLMGVLQHRTRLVMERANLVLISRNHHRILPRTEREILKGNQAPLARSKRFPSRKSRGQNTNP
jgi:hypothetical protein